MKNSCSFCALSAAFFCTCQSEKVYLCSQCLQTHCLKNETHCIVPITANDTVSSHLVEDSKEKQESAGKLDAALQNLQIENRAVQEMTAEIPDYSNPAVRAAIEKYGNFDYSGGLSDDIPMLKCDPVQLDNGAIYIGEWNFQNQRHGRGEQYWKDGSKYEGYWKHDKANGKGRLIHADGEVYTGDWLVDKKNGHGTYLQADGVRYDGEWKDGNQDGLGVETWPNGARYEGSYREGKKEGSGKFSWADGSFYQGQFKANNLDGIGTYNWSDGRIYVGDWKDNKMHGRGIFTWPDGRKYEGEYANDKKEGYGEFTWPDDHRYQGYWLCGKTHGRGTFWANGQGREGEWKDGKRVRWLTEEGSEISP